VRTLLDLLDPRAWTLLTISALALVAERIALVAAVVEFVRVSTEQALLFAGALGLLLALRGFIGAAVRARTQGAVHRASVEGLLRSDVLRASVLPREDAHTAVTEGAYEAGRLLSETIPALLGDALACVALGAYVLVTRPGRVVVVGGVALAVATLAAALTRNITLRLGERAWAAYDPVVDALAMGIGARLELVASGREREFINEARARIDHWTRTSLGADRLSALAGRAPILGGAVAVGAALLLDQTLRAPLATGNVAEAAFFAAILPPFASLARSAHELTKQVVRTRPVRQLIRADAGPKGGSQRADIPCTIELRDVTFAYRDTTGARGPDVLSTLSFAWTPGTLLALEGANGSGKSTCLRLLLGLGRLDSGTITVGGTDLFELDLSEWRRHVAYLPQRPFFAERATVRESMRLTGGGVGDNAMREVLEAMDLWSALEHGGPDPLGRSVGTLSAGQRQRVALARVLLSDAPIVLLDEPDANLDAAGVGIVGAHIRTLAARRMVAIVAHTPEILALADARVRFG
jgi:ABC-type multidrug transport system fused ATPase/permease subunit